MIVANNISGKSVAVMGLARSGLSVIRALKAGGANIIAWDDDPKRRIQLDSEGIILEDLSQIDFKGFEYLVLSPGIPHTHPIPHPTAKLARESGVRIIGDIEIFIQNCSPSKIIGATGTNGKSTTTALIGFILDKAGVANEVGGNIGRPVLEFENPSNEQIHILELSSYQLELTPSWRCNFAVLLNISADHIDRHGGIKGYVDAKRRILEGLEDDATAVIGIDDDISKDLFEEFTSKANCKVIPISGHILPQNGVGLKNKLVVAEIGGVTKEVIDLSKVDNLLGSHNAQNVAAAVAVSIELGIDVKSIKSAVSKFPGLPHRQEIIGSFRDIAFVNDSKATNAEAASKALGCYSSIYWIAGGLAKEGGIKSLIPHFLRIRHAFLVGESSEDFARILEGHVNYTKCGTLDKAVSAAIQLAEFESHGNSTVLLSPAAASFDQFVSFEERGDVFRDLVSHQISTGVSCRRSP